MAASQKITEYALTISAVHAPAEYRTEKWAAPTYSCKESRCKADTSPTVPSLAVINKKAFVPLGAKALFCVINPQFYWGLKAYSYGQKPPCELK